MHLNTPTLDLQNVMSTQKLTTIPAFHGRKFIDYNVGMHCLNTEISCFFWEDLVVGRSILLQ